MKIGMLRPYLVFHNTTVLSSASELFPESLVVVCQYRKSCNGSVSSCVSKPRKTNRACASYVRSALGKKPVWEPACFRETGIIITTCINVHLFLQRRRGDLVAVG